MAYYLKMSENVFVLSWKKSCLSKTFFIIHHAYHPPPPSRPPKRTNFLKENSFFIISKNAKHFLYLALIIVRYFLSFYNIFFLYSNNLCFSSSGRFLYRSQPYLQFFCLSSLKRLMYCSWVLKVVLLYYLDNI